MRRRFLSRSVLRLARDPKGECFVWGTPFAIKDFVSTAAFYEFRLIKIMVTSHGRGTNVNGMNPWLF